LTWLTDQPGGPVGEQDKSVLLQSLLNRQQIRDRFIEHGPAQFDQ